MCAQVYNVADTTANTKQTLFSTQHCMLHILYIAHLNLMLGTGVHVYVTESAIKSSGAMLSEWLIYVQGLQKNYIKRFTSCECVIST